MFWLLILLYLFYYNVTNYKLFININITFLINVLIITLLSIKYYIKYY